MSRTIIIVTGGPGTGKSYMAGRIAEAVPELLLLPYDKIKEKNFDRFGFDNEEQKTALNQFSLEEFYLCLRKNMRLSMDILIEYPFYQIHRQRLEELIGEYCYTALTVLLYGDRRSIYERGLSRDGKEGRHPGHLTDCYHQEDYTSSEQKELGGKSQPGEPLISYEQFCRMLDEKDYNLHIGEILDVDVTILTAIPYDSIINRVKTLVHGRSFKSATESLSVR